MKVTGRIMVISTGAGFTFADGSTAASPAPGIIIAIKQKKRRVDKEQLAGILEAALPG